MLGNWFIELRARFSYLLALKRRFSNPLYLDLELFSIFGERNRILRVGSVHTNGVLSRTCLISSVS